MASPTVAQERVQQAQERLQLANAAYHNGDYASQAKHLQAAFALNSASLRAQYNLACAYALLGEESRSLEILDHLAELGVDYGMAEDPDLASLRAEPAFESILARLERNVAPVITARPLMTIAEFGLIPEGIAHDSATGRTFFGSMRTGDIYVLDSARRLSRFAAIDLPGFSAIGLTVDQRRETLWIIGTATEFAAVASPQPQTGTPTEGVPEETQTRTPTEDAAEEIGTATEHSAPRTSVRLPAPAARTGLSGFDLASGAPSARFLAEPSVEGFNDVAVAPDGSLYLSGSRLSVISVESGAIRPLSTSPMLIGTNGITVSPNGTKLFTSVYPVGIASVDLASGQADFLELPENATLYGIDGLYIHEGSLVAVQNGTEPWRLIRIELDDGQRAVTAIHVLERGNPRVTATTGAIAGDEIFYIGQGPAPEPVPTHVPDALVPFFGQTLIMAAPLD